MVVQVPQQRVLAREEVINGLKVPYYQCGCHGHERVYFRLNYFSLSQRVASRITDIYNKHFGIRTHFNYTLNIVDATSGWYTFAKSAIYASLTTAGIGVSSLAGALIKAKSSVKPTSSERVLIYTALLSIPVTYTLSSVGDWAREKMLAIAAVINRSQVILDWEEGLAKFLIHEALIYNVQAGDDEVLSHVKNQWIKFFTHTCASHVNSGNYLPPQV